MKALSASSLSVRNSKIRAVLLWQCMSRMRQGAMSSVQLSSCRGNMGLKMGALHKQDGMSTEPQERVSHLKLASRSSHSTFHFLDRHFTFHSGCSRGAWAFDMAQACCPGHSSPHGSNVT